MKINLKEMKYSLPILFLALIFFTNNIFSQQSQKPDWTAYKFLIGEWSGEGSGQPGQATGNTTHKFDLNDNVLVRKNHTEYPASNGSPAVSHDDLLIFYNENNSTKAIYFDNEGHVIHYTTSFTSDSTVLVLTGNLNPSTPRFRFTYIKLEEGRLKTIFEISPPGKPEEFMKYAEGVLAKKN
jgi:hypothetical protein